MWTSLSKFTIGNGIDIVILNPFCVYYKTKQMGKLTVGKEILI